MIATFEWLLSHVYKPTALATITRSMSPLWISVFLLPLVSGSQPDTAEEVRKIIASINQFTAENNLAVQELPDVDLLTIVKAVNGKASNFSTLQLRGDPTLSKTANPGSITTVFFNADVRFQNLLLQYDLIFDLKLFAERGGFSVSVGDNLMEVAGQVSYNDQGFCKVAVLDLKYRKYGDFKIDTYPYKISAFTWLFDVLVDFSTYLSLPLINKVLSVMLLSSQYSDAISTIICDGITH